MQKRNGELWKSYFYKRNIESVHWSECMITSHVRIKVSIGIWTLRCQSRLLEQHSFLHSRKFQFLYQLLVSYLHHLLRPQLPRLSSLYAFLLNSPLSIFALELFASTLLCGNLAANPVNSEWDSRRLWFRLHFILQNYFIKILWYSRKKNSV